ncbi:MAG: coproporphyrinogen dehydrogenase HemZ [Christensenellales bacterium]|jgi:coproporphyrinogen dehydrogenase HemZ
MVTLVSNAPQISGEICDVIKLFYPGAKIASQSGGQLIIKHTALNYSGNALSIASACGFSASYCVPLSIEKPAHEQKSAMRKAAKISVFRLLRHITGYSPPWGSLTGVRPLRIISTAMAEHGEEAAKRQFIDELGVSEEKTELALSTAKNQLLIPPAKERDIDIYIGIPFCRTRCAYCSFSSVGIEKKGRLIPSYTAALIRELNEKGKLLIKAGWNVRAIYVGGGTPTAIDAGQLYKILSACTEIFGEAVEFTVEAGRPDTIDAEKLSIIKQAGAGRISINPQTMNDATLLRLSRGHDARSIETAFYMAREKGFSNINMDIIMALPKETASDFAYTLEKIEAMRPDSLTVHALALKRASALKNEGMKTAVMPKADDDMPRLAYNSAAAMGMRPYYIYRQKNMAGNLENIGYCKPGLECLYNVDTMDDSVSIAAFGAGGVSKRFFPSAGRIERTSNAKDVEQYIEAEPLKERFLSLFIDN